MDNDVQGTEYCIGFSTAITRAQGADQPAAHDARLATSGSASSASSAATPASRPSTRPTSPRSRCVIPEAPFDLDRLADLLTEDRRGNPSRYALVIASEGAIWQGASGRVGEADAYGHRHKANIGEALAEELNGRTGIETVASELTYDLRSGEPDMLDQMVAITFANVAMDLLAAGVTGRMMAIRDGKYTHAPLPQPGIGPRRVDVADMYNVERFRPRYDGREGDPLLLLSV